MAPSPDTTPKYMIGVAAALVGMHPQTLRLYEARGLVRPRRTPGGTRLYSDADLEPLDAAQPQHEKDVAQVRASYRRDVVLWQPPSQALERQRRT